MRYYCQLNKKFRRDNINNVLNKCLKDKNSNEEIMDQIETLWNMKKLLLEETIAERVKLMPQKSKKIQELESIS